MFIGGLRRRGAETPRWPGRGNNSIFQSVDWPPFGNSKAPQGMHPLAKCSDPVREKVCARGGRVGGGSGLCAINVFGVCRADWLLALLLLLLRGFAQSIYLGCVVLIGCWCCYCCCCCP
jgi:hypothetical protein